MSEIMKMALTDKTTRNSDGLIRSAVDQAAVTGGVWA